MAEMNENKLTQWVFAAIFSVKLYLHSNFYELKINLLIKHKKR